MTLNSEHNQTKSNKQNNECMNIHISTLIRRKSFARKITFLIIYTGSTENVSIIEIFECEWFSEWFSENIYKCKRKSDSVVSSLYKARRSPQNNLYHYFYWVIRKVTQLQNTNIQIIMSFNLKTIYIINSDVK